MSHLEFFFSKNYFVPVDIRGFFNFRFSNRKSQSQQKLAKRITHFTIQFRSKNLSHYKEYAPATQPKSMLLVGVRKKFALHYFQTPKNCTLNFSSKSKCLFQRCSKCKCFFQRCRKLLSAGGLSNFHQADHCLGHVKFVKIFHFIKIFENLTIFQHFYTYINSIKTLKFSGKFGHKG